MALETHAMTCMEAVCKKCGTKHFIEPFFDGIFSEPEKPTEYQIRKYKLYQCSVCRKWFSLLQEGEEEKNARVNLH